MIIKLGCEGISRPRCLRPKIKNVGVNGQGFGMGCSRRGECQTIADTRGSFQLVEAKSREVDLSSETGSPESALRTPIALFTTL